MSELDMEKDVTLDEMEVGAPEEMLDGGDDFGLDEFAADASEALEDALAEYASADVTAYEEVGMEKIASCFPDWSLTPEEMFKADESNKKNK